MGAREDQPRLAVGRGGPSVALGSIFFLLYFGWGLAFHIRAARVFYYTDQLFDADIPTRIMELARFGGPHRTRLHPLFALLLNPIGQALRAGLRAAGFDRSGRLTALLMSALAGALGVALFHVLLRRFGLAPRLSWLWSVLFGLSSSQLFFGSIPESFVFSGLSLVILFALSVGPPRPAALFLAGVGSFGMAVTNLAAALLVRASSLQWDHSRKALRSLVFFGLGIVLLAAALSLAQLWIYPGSSPFFLPTSLHRDDLLSFVFSDCPSEIAERGQEVIGHLFFANLVAPKLMVTEPGGSRTEVDFAPLSFETLRGGGLVHGLLWAGLLLAGLVFGLRRGLYRGGPGLGLLLWVALHAALHFVFGTSLFLYSCQWTFAVVALAALSLDPIAADRPAWGRALVVSLLVLIGIEAATNAGFLLEILRIFSREPL